jgi:dTDP-4-dehydrorhamnose reductase
MKILLLGAQGNLGTAFLEKANEYPDHIFIGWDKNDIDVTDRALIMKKVADLEPDVIINTVAFNDVDGSENNLQAGKSAEELNCNLVKNLADLALEHNCLLIHYSSDYVFAGDQMEGYDEEAEVNPLNTYGISKAKGEKEIISLSGRGLRWYLIRTARLFGKKGQGANAKPSFFELMLELSRTKDKLTIVSNESGSFTYTMDLVEATMNLLHSGDSFGIYHLVNDGVASWYEAADYFFKKCGSVIAIEAIEGESFSRPARRPKNSRLLNTKRPLLRSWQAAIDEYITRL